MAVPLFLRVKKLARMTWQKSTVLRSLHPSVAEVRTFIRHA